MFSSGAERLFGYRQDEVLGANVKILMPSPYWEAHDGYLAAYRDTGVKKIIGIGREVSGRRKDGSVFPMHSLIGEIWLEEGRFFVGVAHDLTRVKHAEERLLTLSAAVEQSPAAVMISDKDGRIEYVNRCFIRLTGYDSDELIGQNPRVLHSNQAATSPMPTINPIRRLFWSHSMLAWSSPAEVANASYKSRIFCAALMKPHWKTAN